MSKVEVRVPIFAYPRKDPINPCPCEERPVELTYKVCQIFWQVDEGKTVEKGETIAELEAEKKTLELLAPDDGVLKYIVEDAEEVEVNTLIGTILS